MAALVRHDSRQYSWWWDSHISPKNSKWLQDNLTDMDVKVKAMIKLINEDADSFARRAEMYYKKRPELMKLVEEFYRAYRALAERYNQATGALQQAHRTMSEAFPNQIPSMSEESPSSSGKEVEPHTPEMPTPIRAPFDPDDLQKDALGVSPQLFTIKRNGTQPEEASALSSRKGLKQFNDLFSSGESVPRASFFDGKVRKGLSFESPEVKGKEDVSNEMVNLQQEVSRLLAESQNLKQQMSSESERANKAESEIQSLRDTVSHLNSEKDTTLLQYNQSTERFSALESELSKAQVELKKLTDDVAREVEKLDSAETRNHAIQSELEILDQKVKVQEQELEQKRKEMESFHLSLQEESEKRVQAESALLSMEKQYAQSQEEANRLALEIKNANDKLNEFKQMKLDLENTVCELKKEVESLSELNRSSELLIQELRNEINSLKDSKNQLESEIQSLKGTISQLNTEKDGALLQHQQSVERVSDLESQLSEMQSELEKIEQKVQMLVQELQQKREEADNLHSRLQDEGQKCMQTETALLVTQNLHSQSQEEVKKLVLDLENLSKKFNEVENNKVDLENMSRKLKSTISELTSEKDAALLQQQQSLEKRSDLEAQLSAAQSELEKTEQKVQMLEQELEQKNEKVDSLQISLQHEGENRMQAEAALLATENLHSQSQEEASRLILDLGKLSKKLNEVESSKLNLENMSCELKNTISLLISEKDAALLQQRWSLEKVSDLEAQLSKVHLELERIEQKVQILEQELAQKSEKVDSLQINLQDEGKKRTQAEMALLSMDNLYSQSQEEVNRLVLEIENLNRKLNEVENSKADLENVSRELNGTILLLNSEKGAALLQLQQSSERVSVLESQLSKAQLELEKIEQKVQMLEQELAQKREQVDSLQTSLQDEGQKRMQGEAALLSMDRLLSQSQEEVNRLALEIEKLNGKLNEAEKSKMDLESIVSKHMKEIGTLSEQNLSAELMIKDLHHELDALKEMKAKLENEVGLHLGEKEVLQREFSRQKEEKENLEQNHCSLTDEMDALKSNAATLQQLLDELQITNFELKEACAKYEIEKACLSEKVQDMEKLSDRYSVLENSLSDANAEMETLRENIKALEASESSLKDEVSSLISEKAALASQLEILGQTIDEISEKNSILENSLSDANAELGELRIKLKDSEESCQSHVANKSALLAEKNNIFSQLESITMVMKALEGKHADLEEKHSSLSRKKDLVDSQVKELQDQLGIRNLEHEAVVQSHQMQIIDFEKQISSLQEKNRLMDEMLEQEQQKSMSTFISILILETSLADFKDKNFTLFNECQKYLEATHHAEMLISRLKEEARNQEGERKALLEHNEKLREGISQHMKVLNICKDLGPADIAHDEILVQIVSHEIGNILKLKEDSEDVNRLMNAELSVLATILTQIGLELRDLHLQKCDLEKEVEIGAAELLSLQNKNHQLSELNEQLRQGLQKGSEREEVLKTEMLGLSGKLSCLRESYETSQDEICNLNEKNESLSREYKILMEKYNVLEDENGAVLAECMMLENLSMFFRSHNSETASALILLTDEMASLNLVKGKLDHKVKVLSRKAAALEVENKHLHESLVYLVEDFRTRLLLLEFDSNTSKSVCQELAIELENGMVQLMQKDDELMEADEKVQFLQGKNKELCRVLGALQVAIEGAKVVKGDLEKKITTLTEESSLKDDEILHLHQANKTLQGEVDTLLKKVGILKTNEESLTSALEFVKNEVERNEREIVMLVSDLVSSAVNATVYEEKVLELMMEGEALEISGITQREMLMKEISSRDAYIDDLQKKTVGMEGENAELKADLGMYLPLIASLSDHVNALEKSTLSLSKLNKSECKEEAAVVPSVHEVGSGLDSHHSPAGALELQKLIARVEALQVVILDAKVLRERESTESAAKLEAANVEIQELKAKGGLHKEGKERCVDDEKRKDDAESSRGKQVQMMKDIELDQVSTCSPYGTGAGLYPLDGNGSAELDDEMLQLWETAERDCKNQTAKSSSSEHDIQAVEEVKSECPSSELARGRDLGVDRLEMLKGSLEPQQEWSKKVIERLALDAQRLSTVQVSIEELKRKMEGSPRGKSSMSSEYNSIKAQLHETEGAVLEQVDMNNKLTKKAENYSALSDSVAAEQEGYSSRRKISEEAQKASEKVGRLELELQKMQYVLLKLEEEHEYRRVKVSEKRTRVLLRDYLYGRKDNRGGQKKKKRIPFCGCMRPKTKTES